jgi:hypothetical protein
MFAADAMVIGDMGSIRPGVPALTVALKGTATVFRINVARLSIGEVATILAESYLRIDVQENQL